MGPSVTAFGRPLNSSAANKERNATKDERQKTEVFFNRLGLFNTAFVGRQFIFDEHALLSVINPRGRDGPLIFAVSLRLAT